MNNQDNHPMDPSNLHQKSEGLAMERTAGSSEVSADLSPEEMWKTIHELRLQQIELERQNEALRTDQTQIESERKYKTLFREMLDGFALHELICDEQGSPVDYRFLDVNPAFERMTGLKAGAILGRTVLEVIPGTEKHWIETYGKVALTGEPVFFENCSAELGKHFEVKAFRPYDGQFICIIQDITERKQADHVLRECEEKISGVLNNVKAVVWSISWPDLTPIYISPSVENLYDIRKQAFIDNPSLFKELCHPDDKHLTEKAINQLLEEGQSSREYRIIKPDGSIVWIHDKAMFIYDKNHHPVRVDGLAQDITERKRAEEALQQKNREMEQLVYIVSHDLKSPLVTVKTFMNILRQGLQGGDQQQINENLNYIDKAADKMQQLLDALVQYSRIGTVDAPAQTLSANQSVEGCLATLAGILLQHQVQVSTGDLLHQLHGDPLHFGQIWQNLVENAVKYRGDQAQPHIEIGATQDGQDVVFYVRDNGMGIEPKHNERIFNLFSQLNPGSDGSGLGLALVKKIVTIYQGRIWVESDGKGKGSCFYFTLPGALIKGDKTT